MSKVIGIGFDFAKSMSFFPLNIAPAVVTSGALSGDFGLWAEIASDIGSDDIYLEYIVQLVGSTVATRYQIGIGSGGSEVFITDNIMFSDFAIEQNVNLLLGKTKVPANSRLAIRVADRESVANPYNLHVHYSKR